MNDRFGSIAVLDGKRLLVRARNNAVYRRSPVEVIEDTINGILKNAIDLGGIK